MSNFFHSCKGCTERTPLCHGSCEKYLAEKAEHEKHKAALDQKLYIEHGIYNERSKKCIQATRYKRKRWGNY